jgi:hypothetical protein
MKNAPHFMKIDIGVAKSDRLKATFSEKKKKLNLNENRTKKSRLYLQKNRLFLPSLFKMGMYYLVFNIDLRIKDQKSIN